MNDLQIADQLIQEGVDEFRVAAARTATGIIEQGLAVLKIKQGCAKKRGGTGFPEVVMALLGLTTSTAHAFATIGERAEKLSTVVESLPAESMTTIRAIALMDDDTIADKIERGVITPTATRANVLEQKRVSKEITVPADDPDAPDLSAVEVYATLPKKHQKALEAHINSEMAKFRKQTRKEVAEEAERLAQEATRLRLDRNRLDKEIKYAKRPFTREEFQAIRGMLHPDRHPGNEDKASRAFDLFSEIEGLCRVSKTPLKSVKTA